jgi:hypothetical protein
MNAERSALPRNSNGASSAGPLWDGGPSTYVPQRRQRQASPCAASVRIRARSSGSSGA